MSKRLRIWPLILVLFLIASMLTACTVSDLDQTEPSLMVPKVLKDVYVYDQGEFISDDQEEVINSLLVQFEEKTSIEFAVITIPTLNDLTIEQYAVRLGNELGIGKEGEDNGILLLVSKTDTKVRLEIGLGLQGIITDSICGRILDDFFVPSREKDQYDDACFNTVHAVINQVAASEEYEFSGIDGLNKDIALDSTSNGDELTMGDIILIIVIIIGLIILEAVTGYMFGYGFGDGIVFLILRAIASGKSSSGGGGSFGGGRFNGGGSSR